MKKSVLAVVASISAFLFASSDETLSAAWFVKDISCKVGTPLAGYGPNDISVEKLDDLQLHGLALDDGICGDPCGVKIPEDRIKAHPDDIPKCNLIFSRELNDKIMSGVEER